MSLSQQIEQYIKRLFIKHKANSVFSLQEVTRVFVVISSVISVQVYAPGPYGDYVTPPPHAPQVIYTADGQPYPGAYPYHYQGKDELAHSLGRGG